MSTIKVHKNNIVNEKQSDIQCRLKWSLSTVFLTTNTTASCHRCDHNPITEDFDFHNTHQKVHARLQMLRNEWPELGCEHCRVIEQAGGMSDRLLHEEIEYAPSSPVELLKDPNAVHVTPTQLEIYFSNLCQLSCTYCGSYFSSTWESENKKYGDIHNFMIRGEVPGGDCDFQELKYLDKVFEYLEEKGQYLRSLYILGGEPFIQPQSDRLLDFIESSGDKFKNMRLSFFSNLSTDKAQEKIDRLLDFAENGKIYEASIIGSIDCWNKQAEYIRFGLDTSLFDKNFKYISNIKSKKVVGSINMCWSNISTFTMPELIDKYQEWTDLTVAAGKPWGVNISLMQVAGKDFMHPRIFGPKILDWGYNESMDKLQKATQISGAHNGSIGKAHTYFEGIKKSIENETPDKFQQQELHRYLTELDRRRETDYRELFPIIYNEIRKP